jgi:DNA-binding transcriptional regulator LsrR (DeoR family)
MFNSRTSLILQEKITRMVDTTKLEPTAGGKADNEILLGVLDLVERDSALTQRSVAKELGIALGLANAYLKRCINKGLVKVSQVPPRRYAYYLTPQGFSEKSRLTASYLAYSFSFFREARTQMGDIFTAAATRGQRRLLLIGEGDLADIAHLVARKHPIELCGTIPATADRARLAEAMESIGKVDAVIVTTSTEPREVFEAAVAMVGADRVYAPDLLRVRTTIRSPEGVS